MKKSHILSLAFMLGGIIIASADTLEDVDFFEAGGNYYCYPWLNQDPPAQTQVPEGYKPFHLEHYGRHGSRWHIGDYNYDKPYELLSKAKAAGKLTPLGEEVFEVVVLARDEFKKGRDGELSDKGAIQHQGIGKRMVENYPEIFTPETNIDAKSTIVIRSILSMFNGLSGIQSLVPDINIQTDASQAEMWYMNQHDPTMWRLKERADTTVMREFQKRHANKGEYMAKIFNDQEYAKDSIGPSLFNPLFSLLVNTQSHYAQPWIVDRVFTPEEARERWQIRNANWFLQSGFSNLTDNHQPYSQANLLNNIMESTDTAINSVTPSVNLRYGHDSIVMPLSCLLEINGYGQEINDLEDLAAMGWHDYLAIPMGANIQIVFYRPDNGKVSNPEDILLKVLLNETEVELPLPSELAPYYKWTDFRAYYSDKIKNHITKRQ
ncbi:MAG: histidine-type phosphatase [Muribaculaceae bacterium]|nr:histidine-type phosphatase [Muribaculaceae bacterium]